MTVRGAKEKVWAQVELALALVGDEGAVGGEARATFDAVLERPEWEDVVWPKDNRGGEQTNLVSRLLTAVLEGSGQKVPEQVVHAVPDLGKWADRDGSPEIIRRPIGAD